MFYYDPLFWLFAIPGLLLGLYAQVRLSAAYNRYLRVPVESGRSGAEAAREILDQAGLTDVPIEEVGGHLTDHYDPARRALFLSSANFHERSIAAVGVAAHEAGHALQHQEAYALLRFRTAIVPLTNIATTAWMGLWVLGMFLSFATIAKFLWIGVAAYSVITLFQLVTLPVEYDASRRAKAQLFRLGIVHTHESEAVSKVLNAAALTYVAALVTAILQLLRLVLLARNRS